MGWIADMFEGDALSDESLAKLSVLESQFAVIESEKVQLQLKADNLEEKVREVEREKNQFQQENQDLRKTREFPLHNTPDATDDSDIIIKIAERLKARAAAGALTIDYHDDSLLIIPKGSIEKHLEEAAKDAGLEIVRKGATQASLRKQSGFFVL